MGLYFWLFHIYYFIRKTMSFEWIQNLLHFCAFAILVKCRMPGIGIHSGHWIDSACVWDSPGEKQNNTVTLSCFSKWLPWLPTIDFIGSKSKRFQNPMFFTMCLHFSVLCHFTWNKLMNCFGVFLVLHVSNIAVHSYRGNNSHGIQVHIFLLKKV